MNLAFMYIADGAAFAPEMERLTELMKIRDDIYLYLPESFEWLLKMSEEEDRTVNLRNVMDFGKEEFVIHVINTNQIVRSMKKLVPIAIMKKCS